MTDLNPVENLQNLSDEDLLARTIWGEARGETIAGKLAVACVVLNRVKAKSWFGSTIKRVILKPYQFSCFNEDDPNLSKILALTPASAGYIECRTIAAMALWGNLITDPTRGATHYHEETCNPSWEKSLRFTVQIGRHLFCRE